MFLSSSSYNSLFIADKAVKKFLMCKKDLEITFNDLQMTLRLKITAQLCLS